jgi:hypothetical protein
MNSTIVIARLYEHIAPIDRGERYEDPLDAVLRQGGVGEVTGGGSQLSETGEIDFADVEIAVANLDDAVPVIVATLETAGAPVGSELIADDGSVLREFGGRQSLAVYLDGTTLPDDVYAALDFDALVGQLTQAAGEDSYHGCWQGPEETGLFFFGSNAEAMFARVEPALRARPIGQNARVVVRPGRGITGSRTVRIPRH